MPAPTALPVLTQLFTWLPFSHFSFMHLTSFLILFPFSLSQAFPSLCFAYFLCQKLSSPIYASWDLVYLLRLFQHPIFLYFLLIFLNKPSPSYELNFENHFFFVETKQVIKSLVLMQLFFLLHKFINIQKKIVATA